VANTELRAASAVPLLREQALAEIGLLVMPQAGPCRRGVDLRSWADLCPQEGANEEFIELHARTTARPRTSAKLEPRTSELWSSSTTPRLYASRNNHPASDIEVRATLPGSSPKVGATRERGW